MSNFCLGPSLFNYGKPWRVTIPEHHVWQVLACCSLHPPLSCLCCICQTTLGSFWGLSCKYWLMLASFMTNLDRTNLSKKCAPSYTDFIAQSLLHFSMAATPYFKDSKLVIWGGGCIQQRPCQVPPSSPSPPCVGVVCPLELDGR